MHRPVQAHKRLEYHVEALSASVLAWPGLTSAFWQPLCSHRAVCSASQDPGKGLGSSPLQSLQPRRRELTPDHCQHSRERQQSGGTGEDLPGLVVAQVGEPSHLHAACVPAACMMALPACSARCRGLLRRQMQLGCFHSCLERVTEGQAQDCRVCVCVCMRVHVCACISWVNSSRIQGPCREGGN